MTMAAMNVNGTMVHMGDVGPGNGGRERKYDQDDRSSQHTHDSLLQHVGPMAPQVHTRYRRETWNSIPECGDADMVSARYIVTKICDCFSVCPTGRHAKAC